MAIEIFYSVLKLAVFGLVKLFDNFRTCGFRSLEMRFHVFDENGQTLSSVTQLAGTATAGPGLPKHDPSLAKVHLGAISGVPVSVVLDESERSVEPRNRAGNVAIDDMRQNNIRGHGTVVQHRLTLPPSFTCAGSTRIEY